MRLTDQLNRKWEKSEEEEQGCVDGEHATEEKPAQLPKPAAILAQKRHPQSELRALSHAC